MFEGWSDFFVLLGTAAGGLIGLLFVVVTLTQGVDRARALRASGIYMMPILVHFGAVLSISTITLVPRLTAPKTALLIDLFAVLGMSGCARTCLGILEFRRGPTPPHWSDFWGYGAAPFIAYALIVAASGAIWREAPWAVYALAAVLLTLLLVGIRNAWDLITWMAPGGVNPPGPPPA